MSVASVRSLPFCALLTALAESCCSDVGEMGSVWRTDKLQKYSQRADALGIKDAQEVRDLLSSISAETAFLEALWKAQKV